MINKPHSYINKSFHMSLSQHNPILKELNNFTRQSFLSRKKKGEQPDPVDHSLLWRCIYDYSSQDIESFSTLFNLFSFYKHAVPEFCNVDEFIKSRFDRIRIGEDDQKELEIFIRLLPFLELNMALDVVELAIDHVSLVYEKNGVIAFDFLKNFKDVLVEDFDYETFKQLEELFVDYFQENESKKRFAAVLVFANLSVDFQKIDSSMNETIKELFLELIGSDTFELQCSGMFLLRKYSLRYQYEPELAPNANELVNNLIPFLNSNNNTILEMGTKTIIALIKCGLFTKKHIIATIFQFFDVLVQNSYSNYFKIIHSIIYPTGDFVEIDYKIKTDGLVQIRDFLIENIKDNKLLLAKGYCINEFENLFSLKKSIARKYVSVVLDESKKIILSKNYAIYPYVTSFIIAVYQNYPRYKEQIEKMMNSVYDLFSNSKNQYTQSIDVAVDLASFINKAGEKPPPILTSFAMRAIESKKDCDSIRGCIVFLEMIDKLNPKLATTIFDKAFNKSLTSKEIESIPIIFELLRKLIKYYPIESKNKDILVRILLNMEHPLISKIPPFIYEPFAKYINEYLKRGHERIKIIIESYGGWFMKSNQHSKLILKTLIIAINSNYLTEKGLTNILTKSIEIIKNNSPDHLNSENVIASIDCLKSIYQKLPKIIPISEIFNELMKYFDNIDLSNFESQKVKSIIDIVPAICDFVFFVHANDKSMQPDNSMFLELIRYLPFPSEVYYNKSIINSLLLLMLNPNFDFLKKHILRVFANILILDRKEFDEFGFDKELENKMIFLIKKSIEENTSYKNKITKHFQNQKRDNEVFEQLLK